MLLAGVTAHRWDLDTVAAALNPDHFFRNVLHSSTSGVFRFSPERERFTLSLGDFRQRSDHLYLYAEPMPPMLAQHVPTLPCVDPALLTSTLLWIAILVRHLVHSAFYPFIWDF